MSNFYEGRYLSGEEKLTYKSYKDCIKKFNRIFKEQKKDITSIEIIDGFYHFEFKDGQIWKFKFDIRDDCSDIIPSIPIILKKQETKKLF